MNLLLRDKQVAPRAGADRRRRGAHVRHGRHVPPDRHLCAVRPEVQAGRMPISCMYYREDQKGQVLQEGITEPGAHGGVDGRGDQLFGQQRADAAVLHLLLDVRFPARRRSLLGRRRHARARLPGRRHRRPHDAERRRPAARGRPFAPDGRRDSELPRVRSDLLVRDRGDPAGRHAPHAAGAGRRLLLHHRDERELRASGACPRAPRPTSSRACTCSRTVGESANGKGKARASARAAARLRHDPARSDRGGRIAREGVRRRQRYLVVPELLGAAPRRLRRRALEPPASDGQDRAQGRT